MRRIRFRKRKLPFLLALGVAALAALLLLGSAAGGVRTERGQLLSSNGERVAYLNSLGWQVEEEPISRESVMIPREFSDVFETYNELQKQQGFDLSDYGGMTLTLYVYRVTNWPDPNLTVLADLYLCSNRVVGGDVHATAMDGFMIGLQ